MKIQTIFYSFKLLNLHVSYPNNWNFYSTNPTQRHNFDVLTKIILLRINISKSDLNANMTDFNIKKIPIQTYQYFSSHMAINTNCDALATPCLFFATPLTILRPLHKVEVLSHIFNGIPFKCVSLELLNKLFFLITIPIDVIRISKS